MDPSDLDAPGAVPPSATAGAESEAAQATAGLSARQRDMFEFERTWWSFDESRDELIRARFGCSPDDYYTELNELLDTPAAMAHDPLVVRRFQRRRARRRRELQGSFEARRTLEGRTS